MQMFQITARQCQDVGHPNMVLENLKKNGLQEKPKVRFLSRNNITLGRANSEKNKKFAEKNKRIAKRKKKILALRRTIAELKRNRCEIESR